MATFTLELWQVLEYTDGDIGLNDYPIFEESYRHKLNGKIIDHYYNQEIGTETISMFKLAIRRRMNEIMPYYNKLYLSEKIEIDPLNTMDIRSESTSEADMIGESEAENTSETGSKSRSVQSDFPQHRLAGDNDYATAAADSSSDSEVKSDASETSTTKTNSANQSHTTGIQGSQADLLMRFRESIINIDVMVIAELADCFMSIWNTNDSYTNRRDYGAYGWYLGY